MLFLIGNNHLLNHTKKQVAYYKGLILMILILGAFFRLFQYLDNRSLWEDEIYLSAGIINFNFKQLAVDALPHLQKAPLGYLWIEKVCVLLFGKNEFSLRLYPLLCGIMGLVLFLRIAQNFLKPVGVIVAIAVFAFAPPLIYHSVEAKPYGTELLGTLIILWWFIKYQETDNWKQLLLLGVYGGTLIWFAFTAIFVLGGIGLTMLLIRVRKKQWARVWPLLIPAGIWVISFLLNYILFARQGSNSGWLKDFWAKHDGYMPLSPAAIIWLIHKIISFLNYPLGLSWYNDWRQGSVAIQLIQRMVIVALIPMVIGVTYLFAQNKRLLLLITSVVFVALMASVAGQYPFHERLTVYLAPLVILLLAAGCQASIWKRWPKVLQLITIFLLIFGPLVNSFAQTFDTTLFGDYKKSYQREMFTYVNSHIRPGDVVYVYWNDTPGYHVYKAMGMLKFTAIDGKDFRHSANGFKTYFSQLDSSMAPLLGKKRVWIIYNEHMDLPVGDYIGDPAWYYKDSDGMGQVKAHFLAKGKLLQSWCPVKIKDPESDVNASLFDFSAREAK